MYIQCTQTYTVCTGNWETEEVKKRYRKRIQGVSKAIFNTVFSKTVRRSDEYGLVYVRVMSDQTNTICFPFPTDPMTPCLTQRIYTYYLTYYKD